MERRKISWSSEKSVLVIVLALVALAAVGGAAILLRPRAPSARVAIAGGRFRMGAADSSEDERPVHEVAVASFELDRTEVTLGQFATCVEAQACDPPHDDYLFCNARQPERWDHPINCVSQVQATQYCAWRGARLPSEEEWEYAARGQDSRAFPWGNEPPLDRACYLRKRSGLETCAVGSTATDTSPFGVLDLGGNVSEWTQSPYCSYAHPTECKPNTFAVRGGSWDMENPIFARATARDLVEGTRFGYNVGFRCARSD